MVNFTDEFRMSVALEAQAKALKWAMDKIIGGENEGLFIAQDDTGTKRLQRPTGKDDEVD